MKSAEYWIDKLGLLSHPEGGYFIEVYRSKGSIFQNSLPKEFNGDRSYSTSIYFLLKEGQKSAFHRIKSDELWHFYDGDPVIIYVINAEGNLYEMKLGLDPDKGYFPQVTIPANSWFAAKTLGSFTLAGCTVSPGFDFNDFELADKKALKLEFPEHGALINKFT